MDYHGTEKDDVLNQSQLALADWTNVYGRAGNDRITIALGTAIGGAGDDTIIGTSPWSAAAYWDALTGVNINLTTGVGIDGLGGTDTLIDIHAVQGTRFNDQFLGSAADDIFWSNGGSDRIVGGGGSDTVVYWNIRSTDVTVRYEVSTDTLVVEKGPSGSLGADTLIGVKKLTFTGPESDNTTVQKQNIVPRDGGANPVSMTIAGYNEDYTVGAYTVQNNIWPDATLNNNLGNGKDYWQQISFNTGSLQSDVVMSWSYPNVQPQSWIYAYPTITWGAGENGLMNNANSHQIKNIYDLTVDYDVVISGEIENFNVTFDVYTSSKSITTYGTQKTAEIMVKVHLPWGEGVGTSYSDGLIDAVAVVRYDIIGAMAPKEGLPTWTYASYNTLSDRLSGTISYSNILKDLVAKGVISADDYVSGVEFGSEVQQGFGTLLVNYFGVSESTIFNDAMFGSRGSVTMDGGPGLDVCVYEGAYSKYSLIYNVDNTYNIKTATADNHLKNVERLKFADTKLALDLGGNAGTTAKILGVTFGAASVFNKEYVGVGLSLLDNGMSDADLMQLAINAAGASTHAKVVDLLWSNLFHSLPAAAEASPYVAMLDDGALTVGALGMIAAELALNNTNINLVGLAQTGIEYS